jgi:hypothetical protein
MKEGSFAEGGIIRGHGCNARSDRKVPRRYGFPSLGGASVANMHWER